MVSHKDHEAERIGIARQALIKVWIAEHLSQIRKKRDGQAIICSTSIPAKMSIYEDPQELIKRSFSLLSDSILRCLRIEGVTQAIA